MMKKSRKAVSVCMALAVLATTLSACSPTSGSSAAASTDSAASTASTTNAEPITLRVSWWGSQTRTDLTTQVLNLYTKEYPNVTIEPEYSDWNGYWDKMATEAASNSLPDVMQQDYSYLDQYATQNQIIALDSYISSKAIDLSNVAKATIDGGKIDGKVVGISLGQNCPDMLIDPDVLADAGIAESDVPDQMTWSQVETMAKTIMEKTGKKISLPGSTGMGSGAWGIGVPMDMIARDMGETMFSADGTALTISKDTLLKYFTLLQDGVQGGWALEIDKEIELSNAGQDGIATGDAWAEFAWANQVVNSDTLAKKNLIIKMYPKLDDATEQNEFMKPSMLFSITSSSKEPEAAAALINYFTNSVEANKVLKAERGVPISSVVASAVMEDTTSYSKDMINFVMNTAKIATSIEPATPASSSDIGSVSDQFVQKVMYGKLTAEEAAEQFYEQAKEIAAR